MKNAKNITVIPATINPVTRMPKTVIQLRRVAAYARVSTDSEEQLTSYEAQVDYYTTTPSTSTADPTGSLWMYIRTRAFPPPTPSAVTASTAWCRMPWTEKSISS